MNVKRLISISLATVISTNMYFTMYANTLNGNVDLKCKTELVSEEDVTVVGLRNKILNLEYVLEFEKLKQFLDKEVVLTKEQEEILESLELMTFDLMQLFIEFDCVDNDNNIIGIEHLTTEQLAEIELYVKEIRLMELKLKNTITQSEEIVKRDYLMSVSEQYNLIENEQFNYDKYLKLPEDIKEKYLEQLNRI